MSSYCMRPAVETDSTKIQELVTEINLLSRNQRSLFLICRAGLDGFYQKFSFYQVGWNEVTPYYRKARWIFVLDGLVSLFARRDRLIIMRLEEGPSPTPL